MLSRTARDVTWVITSGGQAINMIKEENEKEKEKERQKKDIKKTHFQ